MTASCKVGAYVMFTPKRKILYIDIDKAYAKMVMNKEQEAAAMELFAAAEKSDNRLWPPPNRHHPS